MLVELLSLHSHSGLPLTQPGNVIRLVADAAGNISLTVKATPLILRHIADALHDGALSVVTGGGGGQPVDEATWNEIAAERDRLLAEAQAYLEAQHGDRPKPRQELAA